MAKLHSYKDAWWDNCAKIRETPGREPGNEVNLPIGIIRGHLTGKKGTMVRSGYTFAKVVVDGETWWVRQYDIIQRREL